MSCTKRRRAGRRVSRNSARRATRPRTRVAGVWPVGQDDGPPDFILHVLSRGVINVHYCTYCTSEQTPRQPMATATRFSYYCIRLELCVSSPLVIYKNSGDDGRYGRRAFLSSIDVVLSPMSSCLVTTTQRRRGHQRVVVASL